MSSYGDLTNYVNKNNRLINNVLTCLHLTGVKKELESSSLRINLTKKVHFPENVWEQDENDQRRRSLHAGM